MYTYCISFVFKGPQRIREVSPRGITVKQEEKKKRDVRTLREGQNTAINPVLNALLMTIKCAKSIKNNYTATMHESPEQ